MEKRELMCEMFNNDDIQQQLDIKKALDEKNLLNPGKVYPILENVQRKEGFMSTKVKINSQIFQDSNNIFYPKNEEEVSDLIKEFIKKILLQNL